MRLEIASILAAGLLLAASCNRTEYLTDTLGVEVTAEENREYFRAMHKLFIDIKAQKIDNSSMEILSMGMSDDYDVAISEGANLVRIGTALFGKRNYNI